MQYEPKVFEEYPDNALALLAEMEGIPFTDAQMQRYLFVLSQLTPDLGLTTVSALCMGRWRPTPQEIVDRACEIAAPRPDEEAALLEILFYRRHWRGVRVPLTWDPLLHSGGGAYRESRPGEPVECYLVDTQARPGWSHPLIVQVVQALSWNYIREVKDEFAGVLRKQIQEAYKHAVTRYNQAIFPELCKPCAARAAHLIFPDYHLPRLDASPPLRRLDPPAARQESIAASADAERLSPLPKSLRKRTRIASIE